MDKKKLKEIINADLYRYFGKNSFRIFLKAFFSLPGFKYTYFLRKFTYSIEKKSKLRFYYHWRLRRYVYKYGFEISPLCKIGKGFYIGHFGHIIINANAQLGCNVNISPGVIIGRTFRGKKKGIPIIGNNVYIGPNAIIVGNIHIGNNALIAPGSYVNFDVPENAVVLGNPGKIVSYAGTEGYVCNKVDY